MQGVTYRDIVLELMSSYEQGYRTIHQLGVMGMIFTGEGGEAAKFIPEQLLGATINSCRLIMKMTIFSLMRRQEQWMHIQPVKLRRALFFKMAEIEGRVAKEMEAIPVTPIGTYASPN